MYIYNSIVLLLWHKITENWLTLLRAYKWKRKKKKKKMLL